MKPSKAMQHMIEALATKHGLNPLADEAVLKLTLPGYMPLVIRNVGLQRVSIYHYFIANGDIVPDPHIVFWVNQQGWYPIEVTQTVGGHRSYARLNEKGTAVLWVSPQAQADLAEFAEMWAANLTDQGWLEHGEKLPQALFPLGTVLLTPGARAGLEAAGLGPQQIIQRHVSGDWAALNEHDRRLNQMAVQNGDDRVFSVYAVSNNLTLWVITEADRSCTTLLLPEEY